MAETKPHISPEARRYMFKAITEHWKYFERGDMVMLWNCVGFSMAEDGHSEHQKHDEVCQPYYRLALKMISNRMEVLY